MKANVLSRQNAMASNILIGNAKAEEEVQLNLLDLSENEKELILKVLERDKLLQKFAVLIYYRKLLSMFLCSTITTTT